MVSRVLLNCREQNISYWWVKHTINLVVQDCDPLLEGTFPVLETFWNWQNVSLAQFVTPANSFRTAHNVGLNVLSFSEIWLKVPSGHPCSIVLTAFCFLLLSLQQMHPSLSLSLSAPPIHLSKWKLLRILCLLLQKMWENGWCCAEGGEWKIDAHFWKERFPF